MSLTVYILELLVLLFFPPSSLFCFCFFKGETSKLLRAAAHFASKGVALEDGDSFLVERMGMGGISGSASDSARKWRLRMLNWYILHYISGWFGISSYQQNLAYLPVAVTIGDFELPAVQCGVNQHKSSRSKLIVSLPWGN
jgi:hypothetical protein